MYSDSRNQPIPLGNELGKGGAATVYLHGRDKTQAVKIFKPEFLKKEITLAKRIEQLNKLSKVAALNINFGNSLKSIGSWPKDLVKDRSGKIVGFTMETVNNGVDLTQIIFARDYSSAFFKYRNKPYYDEWRNFFVYNPGGIKNRFILSYYLSLYFEKIYNLRDNRGNVIDLELCNFDIKPNNILVSIDQISGKSHIVPYILDLDNLTLRNKSGILSPVNPQFTPEYKAPEGPLNKFYDYYSLAVIFYQLIFDIHPFMAIQGGTRFTDGTEMDFFVKNKCFPWGRNRKYLSRITQNDIKHGNFVKLSVELQTLFLRAFDSDSPSLRPSMNEWSKAFLNYLGNGSIQFGKLFKF
ncbi:MAG: hypothetical protein ACO23V_01990 [Chitinophagaceae bacterium]|jgi:DNA-binding helix-hairpin-helix protein with protein kinase domain